MVHARGVYLFGRVVLCGSEEERRFVPGGAVLLSWSSCRPRYAVQWSVCGLVGKRDVRKVESEGEKTYKELAYKGDELFFPSKPHSMSFFFIFLERNKMT